MNVIILGVGLGIGGILASYIIARIIAAVIARADRIERENQRLEYLTDDPRLASLFKNTAHSDGDVTT